MNYCISLSNGKCEEKHQFINKFIPNYKLLYDTKIMIFTVFISANVLYCTVLLSYVSILFLILFIQLFMNKNEQKEIMCVTQLSSVVTRYCSVIQFTRNLHIYTKNTNQLYIFNLSSVPTNSQCVRKVPAGVSQEKCAKYTLLLPRYKFWRLLEE